MSRPRRGVGSLERLEAILANPEIQLLAAAIPATDPTAGGRPRHYPAFMAIVYEAAISVYGSARQVEAELAHPQMWRWICRQARRRHGIRLPRAPMRRHHYLYLRNTYLTRPEILDQLGEIHRQVAADQARQIGLLDPDGAGSWTQPSLDRLLHGDGKVITPLFHARPGETRVDPETGEIRRLRNEPDAGLHYEGSGEAAWGTKFVLLATRGADVHARILLDVAPVTTPGAEAAVAMDCINRTAPHVPGAQGVVYDTALRGVHHQRLLRDLGLLPINRVAAQQLLGPRRRTRRKRVEKTVFVEQRTITLPDGTSRTLDLYARAGAIGLGTLNAEGHLHFTPLPRVRTHRNADKTTYRWYNDHRLPPHLGGGILTVRLHGDATDQARSFNRAENVRPIPPDDPTFKELFRRRNDAESINRGLDDSLWLRRAHSIGNQRQHLNMLGYALMVNSLAIERHQRRARAA